MVRTRKELIDKRFILQLGELTAVQGPTGRPLVETEDLIPLPICTEATQQYVRDVCVADADMVRRVTEEAITAAAAEGRGIFKAIEDCLRTIDPQLHIEKIGFARAVIETVIRLAAQPKDDPAVATILSAFATNMKALFQRLRQMQRQAERELTSERVSARVTRAKASFLQDHATGAKREHAFVLFEEIEAALDSSEEADQIRLELQALRRDFRIDDDLTEAIEEYGLFCERLERVQYAGRLATQDQTLQEAVMVAKPVAVASKAGSAAVVDGNGQGEAADGSMPDSEEKSLPAAGPQE